VAERDVDIPPNVPIVLVDNSLAALSPLADTLYSAPSRELTIVGVTGTNGKTTTTHFIESIAHANGTPFGIVGTLGARLRGKVEEPLQHTTPFAHELQQLLARFRAAGAKGAVLEVSSHALALHRVDDVAFDVAVFTNLTQDHLDFHRSFEEYRAAKLRLFEMTAHGPKAPGVGVVNADDPEARTFASAVPRILSFGIENERAMLNASNVTYGPAGTSFRVAALRPAPFTVRLPGPFNVANAMAALTAAVALDFDVEAIAEGLEALTAVPGRMTPVAAGDVGVYVDYAHTPDGLRKVLEAARAFTRGRLLCVFGCGGDRDAAKRPIMGAIARQHSDIAIVTSDNPRTEDPEKIIDDIVAGMEQAGGAPYEVIPDRAAAIQRAVASARPGDVVIIAGKGHEPYQLVGSQRIPFSDVAVAREALERTRARC
jgi:UDP-N-acetylmuramoyl-L-alanyl-D-glutamate--2,6-diaminopimelate ligase